MATSSLLERQRQWNEEAMVSKRNSLLTAELNFNFDYPARKLLKDIIPPDSKVLDIGSGPFPHTYLTEKLSVFSVDISQAALLGKKNAVIADAENLPFPAQTFPYIVCKEVYSYVPYSENLLSEILRVLSPKGTLIIINAEGNLAKHDPSKMWLNDFNSQETQASLSPFFEDIKVTSLREIPNFKTPDNIIIPISLKALVASSYQG